MEIYSIQALTTKSEREARRKTEDVRTNITSKSMMKMTKKPITRLTPKATLTTSEKKKTRTKMRSTGSAWRLKLPDKRQRRRKMKKVIESVRRRQLLI